MRRALFRFYAELGDFLPLARRGVEFAHAFQGSPSVKDVIEALGIPHTEVDLVLADGESVGFGWRLRDGARVSVYPVFEAFDVGPLTRVRATPLRRTRFVADVHLGTLARYLRLAGLDVRWERDARDEELARAAETEERIVLTRDRGLLKRRGVTHGYCVRERAPARQLAEVVRRFDLSRALAPFTRCLRCNGLLAAAAPEEVAAGLPPGVRARHRAFRRCAGCGRVYWEGSHVRRMKRLLEDALGRPPEAP